MPIAVALSSPSDVTLVALTVALSLSPGGVVVGVVAVTTIVIATHYPAPAGRDRSAARPRKTWPLLQTAEAVTQTPGHWIGSQSPI
jgi:hypothetical protein